MAGNSAFELETQDGWRAGLRNMLRAEFRSWWVTRTWWVQCLIWIGVVDAMLATVLFAAGSTDEFGLPLQEMIMLYGIFGGMFTTIGVVITMQGAVVGEKISGTAAWVLSKPISRSAFILSKLLANALGVGVTAILVPGIVAYLLITLGAGYNLAIPDFLGGIGVLFLFALYWLAFTLMLGAFYKSRGPVIGIPLALILGQQFILGIIMSYAPALLDFVPFSLVMPAQTETGSSLVGHVILGTQPESWIPVYSSMAAVLIFTLIGIWRFRREEF
jgi:ABC-2 type transport system permease protein